LFFSRRVHVVILAAYYRLPAIYGLREFAEIIAPGTHTILDDEWMVQSLRQPFAVQALEQVGDAARGPGAIKRTGRSG
jgi:hypothetical protein